MLRPPARKILRRSGGPKSGAAMRGGEMNASSAATGNIMDTGANLLGSGCNTQYGADEPPDVRFRCPRLVGQRRRSKKEISASVNCGLSSLTAGPAYARAAMPARRFPG